MTYIVDSTWSDAEVTLKRISSFEPDTARRGLRGRLRVGKLEAPAVPEPKVLGGLPGPTTLTVDSRSSAALLVPVS